MSNNYSPSKRQRETDQARKKQDKAQRRMDKRHQRPAEIEIVSAEDIQTGVPSIEEAMWAIENRGSAPRAAASIPARLFVGGVSDEASAEDLRQLFQSIGPVADVIVMVDRVTRAPRGFGFVTMQDRRDAPRAIEAFDGAELKGRSLVVNVATERGR
jgi:RNA recognition motif. (a.k.a. RRM, RBD, or RNP domain)